MYDSPMIVSNVPAGLEGGNVGSTLRLRDSSGAGFGKRGANTKLLFYNPIRMFHYRGESLLGVHDTVNDVTNEGKNLILDVMFNSGTQVLTASWFLGLISLASYTALAAADVMNSHSGWTEFTGYSESTRVAWGSGNASGQSTTNSVAATFSITSTGTVKGVFATSVNTKSGTTGKLWATALFAADVPVANGDSLKVTYTVSC